MKIMRIILLVLILSGCTKINSDELEEIVYIQEKDSLEPYLVVDDDYGGNILLMRKYVLDELSVYNHQIHLNEMSGYYSGSIIDLYLNNIFFEELPEKTKEIILDTKIRIATIKSVDSGGSVRQTEAISRKVFLPSATELNTRSNMCNKEGKYLKFFENDNNRLAFFKDGRPSAYWLRTAYLWSDRQAWVIGQSEEGSLMSGDLVDWEHSIRPLFCISKETAKTLLN